MLDVQAPLDFLADTPRYYDEKPYLVLALAGSGIDPSQQKTHNIVLESIEVKISNGRAIQPTLSENGFQLVHHRSKYLDIHGLEDVTAHKAETEVLLLELFPDAERVYTWDLRLRKNVPIARTEFDMNDPLLLEGPAKGAHNVTADSGPAIVMRHLSEEDKAKYLKPGYRFRIVNTWRPLLPVLEDRPLAVCDSSSVDPKDLIPADRVYPQYIGEIYYLHHNPEQKWYWHPNQTSAEPLVMMMYDSVAGSSRFCPHVSFENPLASRDARKRESVETRSIVISKI